MKKIGIILLATIFITAISAVAFANKVKPNSPKILRTPVSEIQIVKSIIALSFVPFNENTDLNEPPIATNVDINNAIKNGNASSLASFFNSAIEISLPDNDGTYSKGQAQMILATFFNKNKPKSFTVIQEGNSANNSSFVIGTYVSNSNKSYRVYYVTKKVNGLDLIHHLEFQLK